MLAGTALRHTPVDLADMDCSQHRATRGLADHMSGPLAGEGEVVAAGAAAAEEVVVRLELIDLVFRGHADSIPETEKAGHTQFRCCLDKWERGGYRSLTVGAAEQRVKQIGSTGVGPTVVVGELTQRGGAAVVVVVAVVEGVIVDTGAEIAGHIADTVVGAGIVAGVGTAVEVGTAVGVGTVFVAGGIQLAANIDQTKLPNTTPILPASGNQTPGSHTVVTRIWRHPCRSPRLDPADRVATIRLSVHILPLLCLLLLLRRNHGARPRRGHFVYVPRLHVL